MVQVNCFRDFYNVHSKFYRCLGLVPIFRKPDLIAAPPKLSVGMSVIIATFLILYWMGVVLAFLIERHMNDNISKISNYIQMLGNSVALTTTLGSTVLKYLDFDKIIGQFDKIDANLLLIGHKIDYLNHLRSSKCISWAYLSALSVLMVYDFFITVDKYQMTSMWYWLVSVIPLIFYSFGIYQAMFMIYWIKCRCSLMNKVLKQIRMNANGGCGGWTVEGMVQFSSINIQSRLHRSLIVQPRQKMEDPQRSPGKQDVEILSKLFLIMNELCKLARKIDAYYGLFLLTSIGALFAITSIQMYYCYVTAITFDESLKYSTWTLMVSVNLVTVNVSLVVGLCTMCESVSNEATKILQNFSALQIKKDMPDLSELSIWVHPMISSMKFSGYGFFTIDYSMLCGFMTALITYLVIFIQFYALNGDTSSVQAFRAKKDNTTNTVPVSRM